MKIGVICGEINSVSDKSDMGFLYVSYPQNPFCITQIINSCYKK
ncbi:hypothetical protein M128_2936 [Bacteroides fragilis str. S6L8]|uniref:Uncharacterized protein n=1 Tax=Bacteroides fragilis str. S36L11 TaxID=1339327 RepID=A0A015X1K4_BACFG|nr:hypothetical protein M071_2592 [Bacteroides fragilis str. Ds-233]EXZ28040.1 hypothetical protein M136_2773 [Bacteroides fragilis str. S36L11]EXZ53170.1 hypothetical protein M108_2780 [Bacteroides fragilis str. 3397 T14]EYA09018.1 hypothetical protein M130_2886 [Bacteroides fragilis str. S6R6]EYA29470.1 hypothetical protein M106_1910 [Bacteroides fragilis str. 1009-4-F \